jgi:hypothetical protein
MQFATCMPVKMYNLYQECIHPVCFILGACMTDKLEKKSDYVHPHIPPILRLQSVELYLMDQLCLQLLHCEHSSKANTLLLCSLHGCHTSSGCQHLPPFPCHNASSVALWVWEPLSRFNLPCLLRQAVQLLWARPAWRSSILLGSQKTLLLWRSLL